MKFYFTEEDAPTHLRARDLRAGLIHARHEVIQGRLGVPAPPGTDVWMHGIGIAGSPPMTDSVAHDLSTSSARIAVFQLCDNETMQFERIGPVVAARASLFLRNHWPADRNCLPPSVRGRIAWFPPLMPLVAARPGKSLAARAGGAVFYGTRTGFANLADGKNARDELVRIMRSSNLPFRGGLLAHGDPRYRVDPALSADRLTSLEHASVLLDSKICLAPWGNHPLTYRFFEGLACRCLVVAQSIRATSFLDGGLAAGIHYVEIAPDLSDLAEKVGYYLGRPAEAQRIADAGHLHFRRYFAGRGRLLSRYLFRATVESWGALYRPSSAWGPAVLARSCMVRLFPERCE